MGGKAKGNTFEREVCKELSLWWSRVEADDIFWRTQSSGARATQRKKQKKKTRGQYGDVCSVDSRGRFLTEVCTISLKRGYPRVSLHDLIDKPPSRKDAELKSWIMEAMDHARDSRSIGWLLVMRRDRKEAIVLMPLALAWRLHGAGADKLLDAKPSIKVACNFCKWPPPEKKKKQLVKKKRYLQYYIRNNQGLFGIPLAKFLKLVNRKHIVKAGRSWKAEKKKYGKKYWILDQ